MPPSIVPEDAALALLERHFHAMPPVAALQLRIEDFDGRCLALAAPLAAHVNDKGCAFGGSLASLMTLAAWGLITLRLARAGLAADVFVADSQVRFHAPLFADLRARASLADEIEWDGFLLRLHDRGRAGLHVDADVALPDGAIAASGRLRYVAIAKG